MPKGHSQLESSTERSSEEGALTLKSGLNHSEKFGCHSYKVNVSIPVPLL